MDVEKVADALFAQVSDYVSRTILPLQERINELEAREPVSGPQGEKGDKGETGERGEKGEPGIDGKDAEPVSQEAIYEAVEEYLIAHPPKDGKDAEVSEEAIAASVAAFMEANPVRDGKDGADGKDGLSVTVEDMRPLVESVRDAWALTFEREAQSRLQAAIDRIEKPKDGKDGLGFDDMTIEHDGERTVTLKFSRDEEVREFSFKIPCVIERGVYRHGQVYEKGDGVTFGGCYWIAQRDTDDKPGTGDAWRLAVKKGRDGKDAG